MGISGLEEMTDYGAMTVLYLEIIQVSLLAISTKIKMGIFGLVRIVLSTGISNMSHNLLPKQKAGFSPVTIQNRYRIPLRLLR